MTIKFEGNVNDLLYVNENGTIKSTRLINVDENMDPEKDEILDICLTSSAPDGNHKMFDKYMGKKMTVTIFFN